MSEDELQELVKTVAEAHAGLSEVTFKLRRELTPKGPALKNLSSQARARAARYRVTPCDNSPPSLSYSQNRQNRFNTVNSGDRSLMS